MGEVILIRMADRLPVWSWIKISRAAFKATIQCPFSRRTTIHSVHKTFIYPLTPTAATNRAAFDPFQAVGRPWTDGRLGGIDNLSIGERFGIPSYRVRGSNCLPTNLFTESGAPPSIPGCQRVHWLLSIEMRIHGVTNTAAAANPRNNRGGRCAITPWCVSLIRKSSNASTVTLRLRQGCASLPSVEGNTRNAVRDRLGEVALGYEVGATLVLAGKRNIQPAEPQPGL
jgi:hypothetical protein